MRDVAELTPEEQVALTAGVNLWETAEVTRLGIPAIRVTDGPNGARGPRFTGPTSACCPCGTALAATWDPALVEEVGALLGAEARTKGARVLLAPTVNLHRHPLAGRNFECHSEDPWLSSRMAVAYIRGVQSAGVAATVKHFVANDFEWQRMTASSEVDERALRELYLRPFEAAVREGGAWALMTAYNKLGGTYCSEHPWLLQTVLRDEWGFDGLIMSDWFGTHSTVEATVAGLDLEMPGPPAFRGERLAAAVVSGAVDASVVAAQAARVLQLAERVDARPPEEDRAVDLPEHRALLRRAAASAVVMLENDGVLPLGPGLQVAVIGPLADDTQAQGGGSATVTPHYTVSVLDAIREHQPDAVYEPGCSIHRGIPLLDMRQLVDRTFTVTYRAASGPTTSEAATSEAVTSESVTRALITWLGDPAPGVTGGAFSAEVTGRYVAPVSGRFEWGLSSAGKSRLLIDGEVVVDNTDPSPGGPSSFFGMGSAQVTGWTEFEAGSEHSLAVELTATDGLPVSGLRIACRAPVPEDQLERAVVAARDADVAIVVVGTTPEYESEGFDRTSLSLPGDQDSLVWAVAAVNPRTVVVLNTGAPVDAPWTGLVAGVVQGWFGGQEVGHGVADVLYGDVDPGGRLPTTYPVRLEDTPAFLDIPGVAGSVRYSEGVFMGYRWYDRRDIEPRWCFGHGLSYTTFEFSEIAASLEAASVLVTNTGPVAGLCVVQIYVGAVAGMAASVPRPIRELRGFAKVQLAAGATTRVEVALDAPRRWEDGWTVDPGEYEVWAGLSSRDLRACAVVSVPPPP